MSMRWLSLLFGFRGGLERGPFVVSLAAVAVAFWLGVQGSLAALPWMAEVLAPRGINAAFALNAIWLALGVVFCWTSAALLAKRLRTRGRSPWWAAAAIAPPAVLALLNDAIFLVSRKLPLPASLNLLVIGVAGVVALGIVAECLRSHPDSSTLR